ncbi:MAG: rhodanese-like domain-containing protein [Ignavibacteriota bacterium]
MKINFPKIFFIILVSIIISLIYNHFNPNGLNLIRLEKKLSWETDSLSSFETKDSLFVDSTLSEIKKTIDTVVIDLKTETIQKVEAFKQPKAIKLDLAYKLFKQKILFIDARSPEEFAEGHIKDAINIPFYGSENYSKTISDLNKNETIVTYCSGSDCDIAQLSGEELFEMGFKRVYVFVGGYNEWTKNKYPISTKK